MRTVLSILLVLAMLLVIAPDRVPAQTAGGSECGESFETLPVSEEELTFALKRDFGTITVLGRGSFGLVVKVGDGSKQGRVFKLSPDPVRLIRENSIADRLHGAFLKKFPNEPSPFPTIRFHREYQALELLEAKGNLLNELEGFGPLRLQKSLGAVYELTKAVNFTNEEGFVHRDIKPENILVAQDGRLILTDWGIAAREGHSNQSIGTEGYMTQRQLRGDFARPAMDAYALRQTAISVILGKELYDPELGAKRFTSLRKIPLSSTPYRVYARSPHGIDPSVPRAISAVLWRHSKTVQELEIRLKSAEKYLGENRERNFFKEIMSKEIERALEEDPRRAAAEFITSPELMEAGSHGWLKLSGKAKERLWSEAAALYRLKNDFTIPIDYPWPPILDSSFRTALLSWKEYERFTPTRQRLHDILWGKPGPPF